MYKKLMTLSLVVLFMDPSSLLAATVYLKDGSQVQGTIVGATAMDVQVQTSNGSVRLDATHIDHIDYSDTPAAPSAPPSVRSQPAQAPSQVEQPPSPYPYYRRRRWESEPPLGMSADLPEVFSINFGLVSPTSRISPDQTGGSSVSNGAGGALIGLQYLHRFGPHIQAGLDVNYFDRSSLTTEDLVPFARSDISGDTFMPLAVVKFSGGSESSFARPYVLAGVGPAYSTLTIDTRPLFGYSWNDTDTDESRRLVDGAKWGVGSRLALGVDFHPGAPFVSGLEIGWLGASTKNFAGTTNGQLVGLNKATGSLGELSLAFHWGWRFN